jgi:carboxyl-terminal processing protease
MRLTTARYYTPSGRSIQAKGIVPDIIVEPARLEALEGGANIKESDLEGALQNGTPSLYSEEDDTEKDENMPELSEEAQDDYQLLRAIDLLRGVALYNNQQPVTVGSAIDNEDGDEERKN